MAHIGGHTEDGRANCPQEQTGIKRGHVQLCPALQSISLLQGQQLTSRAGGHPALLPWKKPCRGSARSQLPQLQGHSDFYHLPQLFSGGPAVFTVAPMMLRMSQGICGHWDVTQLPAWASGNKLGTWGPRAIQGLAGTLESALLAPQTAHCLGGLWWGWQLAFSTRRRQCQKLVHGVRPRH